MVKETMQMRHVIHCYIVLVAVTTMSSMLFPSASASSVTTTTRHVNTHIKPTHATTRCSITEQFVFCV